MRSPLTRWQDRRAEKLMAHLRDSMTMRSDEVLQFRVRAQQDLEDLVRRITREEIARDHEERAARFHRDINAVLGSLIRPRVDEVLEEAVEEDPGLERALDAAELGLEPADGEDEGRGHIEEDGVVVPVLEEADGLQELAGDDELGIDGVGVVDGHGSPSVGQRTPTVGAPAASPPGDVAAGQDGSGAPVAPEPSSLLRIAVPVEGLPDLDVADSAIVGRLLVEAARWQGVTDPARLTWDSATATRITFPQFPGREFWAFEVRVTDPAVEA